MLVYLPLLLSLHSKCRPFPWQRLSLLFSPYLLLSSILLRSRGADLEVGVKGGDSGAAEAIRLALSTITQHFPKKNLDSAAETRYVSEYPRRTPLIDVKGSFYQTDLPDESGYGTAMMSRLIGVALEIIEFGG